MAYTGRYELELNVFPDQKFLNFWDTRNGDDVVCHVIDGHLLLDTEDGTQEITFGEFIELVTQREP